MKKIAVYVIIGLFVLLATNIILVSISLSKTYKLQSQLMRHDTLLRRISYNVYDIDVLRRNVDEIKDKIDYLEGEISDNRHITIETYSN